MEKRTTPMTETLIEEVVETVRVKLDGSLYSVHPERVVRFISEIAIGRLLDALEQVTKGEYEEFENETRVTSANYGMKLALARQLKLYDQARDSLTSSQE